MTTTRMLRREFRLREEGGFSILETVIALSILMVVALGLLPLGVIATTNTENQGHLMARTTEYAQDKMEQLLALSFGDVTSDTRVFPAANSGGSGLAIGGNSDPAAPVDKYVDYLDIDGQLLTSAGTAAPDHWFYKRVWGVSFVGTSTTLKQITVTTIVKNAVGGRVRAPQSTVASIKTYPF
jgi:type II secretory pathway pseudopilin PulG